MEVRRGSDHGDILEIVGRSLRSTPSSALEQRQILRVDGLVLLEEIACTTRVHGTRKRELQTGGYVMLDLGDGADRDVVDHDNKARRHRDERTESQHIAVDGNESRDSESAQLKLAGGP